MQVVIIPLLVLAITQGIKVANDIAHGKFSWEVINSYGGMPSSHAALVTSLAHAIAYYDGISTPSFAVALVLLLITVRDAMGFRYQLGIHGDILNRLVKELPDEHEYKFPILKDRLGHTPAQVFVGILVGLCITAIAIAIYENF